jgi:hypothetical protein
MRSPLITDQTAACAGSDFPGQSVLQQQGLSLPARPPQADDQSAPGIDVAVEPKDPNPSRDVSDAHRVELTLC